MRKESIRTIDKIWGEEIILVNDDYCGKLLVLDRNAESSYHYHPRKKETFYCLEGYAVLTIEDKEYMLAPFTRPKTIEPNEKHKFKGITEAIILEVSSFHDDTDVVRITPSKAGGKDSEI